MMKIIIALISSMMITTHLFASHAKGVALGRSGDHITARHALEQALSAKPHDPTLLYDAGVAAFKTEDYTRAAYYFEQAATVGDGALKKEALFNAGNAYAHSKEYDKALASYETIFKQHGEDEKTRHNYELVKKMKEEEQKQEQQKQQNPDQNQDDQNDDSSSAKASEDKQRDDNQKDGEDQKEKRQQSDTGDDSDDNQDGDGQQDNDQKQNDGQKGLQTLLRAGLRRASEAIQMITSKQMMKMNIN